MAKKKNFWGIRMGKFADVGIDFSNIKMKIEDEETTKKVKNKLRKNKSNRR